MHHFTYHDHVLHAEGVPIPMLATAVGTPFYLYSAATLERHYRVFAGAFAEQGLETTVCYAVKANSNLSVIRTLAQMGAGADVVSEGELRRALAAGVLPEKIVFSGVGKTEQELDLALTTGILQINVESLPELEALNALAGRRGQTAAIAVRVNPDVDARTHVKISTGKKENKFGIAWNEVLSVYERAMALPHVTPVSIAMHIGSQLTDLEPYRAAFHRMAELARLLQQRGIALQRLDLGGGLGVPYTKGDPAPPLPSAYARMVKEEIGALGLPILLEPGRVITANAGVLVTRVIYEKHSPHKRFVIVDAAMNDLLRPSLYEGHHTILPVIEPGEGMEETPADVVGPICESGDVLAANRYLSPVASGDLLAFGGAGAYGAVMASTYNSRPLAPEVMVKGDQYAIIRHRQSFEALLAQDQRAAWL